MSHEKKKKDGPKYKIWDKSKNEYIFNRVYDLRNRDNEGNRIMPLGMRIALRESGMSDEQFNKSYKGVVVMEESKIKQFTRKKKEPVAKEKGTRKVRFRIIDDDDAEKQKKEEVKRRPKGKPYHIWDKAKNDYIKMRVYDLRNKDENGNRLMPIGLRKLLTDEEYKKNYLDKSDGKIVVVDEQKRPVSESIVDQLFSLHPTVIAQEPPIKIFVRKQKQVPVPADALLVGKREEVKQVEEKEEKEQEQEVDEDEDKEEEEGEKEEEGEGEKEEQEEEEEEQEGENEKKKEGEKEKPTSKKGESQPDPESRDESYIDDPEYDFLYPELSDPNFNIKIAKRKEFSDTKYDGTIHDIKKQANILCKSDFELMPHQLFVKNFLSLHTPYNSLLLYHGLGTGKTCSAIGISEEMRSYMKQVGLKKTILIVASPNVQDNFRLQLFDERKLEKKNGVWNLKSCVGDSLLHEINPTSIKNLSHEKISSQIRSIIKQYYEFMGYTQFANYINDAIEVKGIGYSSAEINRIRLQKIKNTFNNRLVIIDEVHNIRITKENKNRKSAELLMNIAKHTDNMRLLLMSATPMYNSYEEIIWITNLMNLNDKRTPISTVDIFDKHGSFKSPESRALLQRKLTGYVSYIRGENPYTFPYRVYPVKDPDFVYPTRQFNGKPIAVEDVPKYVPVYMNTVGDYQLQSYNQIIENLRKTDMQAFNDLDSFGYTMLQGPIEALNMVYPTDDSSDDGLKIGKRGLSNVMNFKEVHTDNKPQRYNFEYKSNKYGRIFNKSELYKYSAKIAKICDMVRNSVGIVMVYSQYIDGGAVPMALALEEMGFTRYGYESYTKSLFKTPPVPPVGIDSNTKMLSESNVVNPAKYVMITGDKTFSPNNDEDIKYLNSLENLDGEKIKVVIISRAAGEGIDFKKIRQVHILEPWYNMNRIDQIIGRAVRNMSHCSLPFEKRNVEIFLHATAISTEEESADQYVYRLAEHKAIEIGKITRLLKEVAVDCLLNIGQSNFTVEKLLTMAENKTIRISLSSGKEIDYKVGDRPFTETCDYMDNCAFTCAPSPEAKITDKDIKLDTYNTSFVSNNNPLIIQRIRDVFSDVPRGRHFLTSQELIDSINVIKQYPIEQIYSALTYLTDNENEHIVDRYGRIGNLRNNGEYYIFQPIEITDTSASIYDRVVPVDSKHSYVHVKLPARQEKEADDDIQFDTIMSKLHDNYKIAFENKNNADVKSWYGILRHISEHIKDAHKISIEQLKKHTVYHMLDELNFNTRLTLLNVIYNKVWKPSSDFEITVRDYFDERMVTDKRSGAIGYLLCKDNTETFKVYSQVDVEGKLRWEIADHTTSDNVLRSDEFKQKYIFNKASLNDLIGIVAWWEGHDEYVFKTRDLNDSVKVGAKVSQAQIKNIITKINKILGETVYTIVNYIDYMGEGKTKLVVLFEILLREFNETKKDHIWFLSNEQVIVNRINNYSR